MYLSSTGARAKAWSDLEHAKASLYVSLIHMFMYDDLDSIRRLTRCKRAAAPRYPARSDLSPSRKVSLNGHKQTLYRSISANQIQSSSSQKVSSRVSQTGSFHSSTSQLNLSRFGH